MTEQSTQTTVEHSADEPCISERQLQILKHALGISQSGYEYRNHFDPGEKDVDDCAELEKRGLMCSFSRSWLPNPMYKVTDLGKFAVHYLQQTERERDA